MYWKVLIAHAKGEDELAEQLAEPIRDAGYDVVHEGTVLVGESVVGETARVLSDGGPVVLCGTARAAGSKWAKKVVNAAQQNASVRVFVVQMEEDADLDALALGGKIAHYSDDPTLRELIAALRKHFPLPDAPAPAQPERNQAQRSQEQALARYRALALESCDIVDLANMPETDRHVATRQLELRRLYVPLRVRVEVAAGAEADEATLEVLEKRRGALLRGNSSQDKSDGGEQIDPRERIPAGLRLAEARRLVVLGDPGAGKSTLLRWTPRPTCCASSKILTGGRCRMSRRCPTRTGCRSSCAAATSTKPASAARSMISCATRCARPS